MYRRLYSDTSNNFYDVLEELYENSCQEYIHGVMQEADCFDRKNEFIKIQKYVSMLEEYVNSLLTLGYTDEYDRTIKKLKIVKSIAILPKEKRYNLIEKNDNKIKLNPKVENKVVRKYLFSSFNTVLHNYWLEDLDYYFKILGEKEKIKETENDELYIKEGFKLIDKATSMETTQKLITFVTNEDYNNDNYIKEVVNEFSKKVIPFKEDNIHELSKESYKDNFLRKITNTYISKEGFDNYYNTLTSLGRVNIMYDKVEERNVKKLIKF